MELARIEQNDRNRIALRFRATLFFIFFFISMFVIFMFTSILQGRAITRYICVQRAVPGLQEAARYIDGDAFERLVESGDDSDPYYEETRLKLFDIKNEMSLLYLYTMAPLDKNTYQYVIDGSAEPDDEENFSAFGDEEDINDLETAMLATMNEGTMQFGTIDQSEDWGATISAYVPIRNSAGETVGLIGCDIEAEGAMAWIRSQILWQLGVVFIFSVMALAIYLWLIRRVYKACSREIPENKKDRKSLRLRYAVFYGFFIVALSAVFFLTSVFRVKAVIRFICSELATPTVEQVQNLIDPDGFKRLVRDRDMEDPYWVELHDAMLKIKESTGSRYPNTMAPSDSVDRYMYIVDGSAESDDEENFSPLGYVEVEYDPSFFEAIQTREIAYGEVDESEWGVTVPTYAPIFDANDSIIGVVGCDLAGDGIRDWINTQITGQIITVGIFIIAGLIGFLLIFRRVGVLFPDMEEAPAPVVMEAAA